MLLPLQRRTHWDKAFAGKCSPVSIFAEKSSHALCRQGHWENVAIPLNHFLLTWKGQLVEQKTEINAKRVISVGISLAGGDALQPQGTFNLGLEWIKAERRLHGLEKD